MTPENARRPYQDIVEFMLTKLADSGVLTDLAPGSVARTVVEATAREFSELYARMNAVYDAGFINTATGPSLDQLVALVGITRLDGEAQVAEAKLTRDSRIKARVFIPAGTELAATRITTEDKVIYTTDDDYELLAGENSVTVTIRALPNAEQTAEDVALTADDATNGVLTQVRPIAGIAGLSLVGPSSALGVRETDEQLRDRAKMAIASAGGGTAKALEDALMAITDVKSVQLRDASDLDENGQPIMPPGELEIVLETSDANLVLREAEITAAIEAHKGPGILARVRGTAIKILAGTLSIRPASNALTGGEMIKLIDDCNALLKSEVEAMGIGGTLTWNRVLAGLMGIDNVADVAVDASNFAVSGDAPLSTPADITMPAFTRLQLGEGTEAVAIKPVETPLVTLDVTFTPGLREPSSADITALTDTAIEALDAIVDDLNARSSTQPRTIDLTALLGRFNDADGLPAPFAFAATADTVRLNVIDMAERSEAPLTGTTTTITVPGNTLITLATNPLNLVWEPETP